MYHRRKGGIPFCWMKHRYSRVSGWPCARQVAASQVAERMWHPAPRSQASLTFVLGLYSALASTAVREQRL